MAYFAATILFAFIALRALWGGQHAADVKRAAR
jgi:hypothetical protein